MSIQVRRTAISDEARFDRGGWLALALAFFLLLWPVATTLISYTLPADGWTSDTAADGYRLLVNVTGQPSPLRAGDRVVAINGQSFSPDRIPPLPANLEIGQVLRYTIRRDGQTFVVDVPLVQRPVLGILRHLAQVTRQDASVLIVQIFNLLMIGFVFLRRPGNRAAHLLLLIASYNLGYFWVAQADLNLYLWSYPWPLAFLISTYAFAWPWLVVPALMQLALVFPIRKWPVRRFPQLLPALLHGIPACCVAMGSLLIALTGDTSWGVLIMNTRLVVPVIGTLVMAASLLHSFLTVREPVLRAQTHWVALGLGVGLGGPPLVYLLFEVVREPAAWRVLDFLLVWLPVLLWPSLAIAITRYRLFDIDIIIRRTLQYTILTVVLALVYVGSVVLLQQVFRTVSGQAQNPLVTVVSTLSIAALFHPVRHQVQNTIDRRFYRHKYDAERVLAKFSATMRDETDLAQLSEALLVVVKETMQPAYVVLLLRKIDGHSVQRLEQPPSQSLP